MVLTALCGLIAQLIVTDTTDAVVLVVASGLLVSTVYSVVGWGDAERARRQAEQTRQRLQTEREALAAALREQTCRLVRAESARTRAEQRAGVAEQQLAEVIVLSRGAYLVMGSERRH